MSDQGFKRIEVPKDPNAIDYSHIPPSYVSHEFSTRGDTPADDDIQPEPVYDFKFDRIGGYWWTTVSITATLPFKKLYLLYALPALILRAYWQAIKTSQHAEPATKEQQLAKVQDYFNQEKQDMEQIESITNNVDLFDNSFPNIIKKA